MHNWKALFYGFLILLALFTISSCMMNDRGFPPEVATIDRPAISPSGKYILQVTKESENQSNFLRFQILNENKDVIFMPSERFAERHTTLFLWDEKDRVWVYSGDLGTSFWELNETTGDWNKHDYSRSNVTAPEFLKKVRPQQHKK